MPLGFVAEMAIHTLGPPWVIQAKAKFGSDSEQPLPEPRPLLWLFFLKTALVPPLGM